MDYLWIYTSIAGALLGAASLMYIKTTKIGIWGYSLFDKVLDFIRDRYGITWLDQDPYAWKKAYPEISSKLDELEAQIKELQK
jgi:hypothetical protein|tara:strand:- start:60 stop:308 length:249 start_codon:yes stop_codon:yes gene_type:complete